MNKTLLIILIILTLNSCVKQKPISDEQPTIQAKPMTYLLGDKYPNPFSPTTTIEYSIPDSVNVLIVIYNVKREIVDTAVNQFILPGTYKVELDCDLWDSGIYFYRMTAGEFTDIKKMVLLK